MTRATRLSLAAAAVLTTTLAAAPARADHDDRDEHHGRRAVSVAVVPAPVVVYRHPMRPAPVYVPAPAPWQHARWRAEARFDALRHEYRDLDLARDRFYATWDGNPWTRDRFEAWCAGRRAELDARWAELERWR